MMRWGSPRLLEATTLLAFSLPTSMPTSAKPLQSLPTRGANDSSTGPASRSAPLVAGSTNPVSILKHGQHMKTQNIPMEPHSMRSWNAGSGGTKSQNLGTISDPSVHDQAAHIMQKEDIPNAALRAFLTVNLGRCKAAVRRNRRRASRAPSF